MVTLLLVICCAAILAAPSQAVGPYPDLGSCQVFPAPPASLSPRAPSLGNQSAWNQDVSKAPRDPRSAAYISYIDAHGGDHMHPDFGSPRPYGFPFSVVGSGQAKLPIHYTAYGEESDPGPFPIPAGAPVEGGNGSDGDRHVLTVDSRAAGFTSSTAPLRRQAEAALERRRRYRLGPQLDRAASRGLDLRRRRRAADLPRPDPL